MYRQSRGRASNTSAGNIEGFLFRNMDRRVMCCLALITMVLLQGCHKETTKTSGAKAVDVGAFPNPASNGSPTPLGAESSQNATEINKALIEYTEVIRKDPSSTEAYYARGTLLIALHQYERAIADFDKVIRLNPKLTVAYVNRGLAYERIGKLDIAIADQTEAIRLDPTLAIAFDNRGIAYARIGKNDDAIADHSQAIRLDPNFALAYVNRGSAFAKKGSVHEAIEDFTQAIQLNSQLIQAYYNRGRAWEEKSEDLNAVGDYEECLRIHPTFLPAHQNLAWLKATSPRGQTRNGEVALEHAQKACDLTSWKDPESLVILAAAHAELAHFEDAIKWQQEAVRLYNQVGNKRLEANERLLEMYKQGRAYRMDR